MLKFFLHLRRSPGKNFAFISKKLQQLNIPTLEVVKAEDFLVITKERTEPTLWEYLKDKPEEEHAKLLQKQVDLIVKIYNSGITFVDFAPNNFLYDGNDLIVIDLDNFKADLFISRPRKKVLNHVERYYGKEVRIEIDERWIHSSISQRLIDFVYSMRGKYQDYHFDYR